MALMYGEHVPGEFAIGVLVCPPSRQSEFHIIRYGLFTECLFNGVAASGHDHQDRTVLSMTTGTFQSCSDDGYG